MATQRGPAKAGMTGLFDFPRLGASGVNFTVEIVLWKVQQEGQTRPGAGRGSTGFFKRMRYLSTGGGGVATGIERGDGWPAPTDWEGAEGTVRIDFNKTRGQYALYPIKVTSFGHLFDTNRDDEPKETLGFVFTDIPTFYGWPGTQPTAATITKTDQAQWVGSSKTIDPSNLQCAAVRLIDVWGALANSDSAEQGKLAAVISAAVPPLTVPHNAKLRTSTYARDAIDGGTVTEAWGLTTPAEDVIDEASANLTDPDGIDNSDTEAAFNSDPNVPAGFSDLGISLKEYNDSMILHIRQAGVRTRKQGIEQDGTSTNDDPYNIVDDGKVTIVTASSTVPGTPSIAGMQLLAILSQQFQTTPEKWRHTFFFGNTNSAQRITFPASPIDVDPTTIKDSDSQSQITSSSTAPSTPSPRTADLQLRRRLTVRITGTPEQWQHTFEFSRNTVQDDIEVEGANQTTDPDDIEETAVIRRVTNSSTPPSPPSAPVGQLVETETQPLVVATGAYTGRWVHIFRYGPTSKLQKIEFGDSNLIVDPSAINDAQVIAKVNSSGTPPATPTPTNTDLQLVRRRSRRFQGTPEKWEHIFEFARNTAKDEIQLKNTKWDLDLNDNLDNSGRFAAVYNEADYSVADFPLSLPSELVGFFQVSTVEVYPLTVPSGAYIGLWLHVITYEPNTRKQKIQQNGTELAIDPVLLDGEDVQTLVNTSSTPPATPTALITGQVLFKRVSKQLQNTPAKWEHKFYFAYRTSAGKLVSDRAETTTDVSGLASTAVTGEVWLVSGGAPTTPTLSTYKLRDKKDLETNNPLYRLRLYFWGLTTREDDEEMGNTVYEVDQSSNIVGGSARVSIIESDATPDGGVSVSGLVLRDVEKKQRNDNKWLITYIFGQTTPEQDELFRGTEYHNDPSNLEDSATVTLLNTSATVYPVALDTPPTVTGVTLQLIEVITKPLTSGSGMYAHRGVYGLVTNQQKLEFAESSDAVSPTAPAITEVATIVTSTNTLAIVRAGLLSTNQASPTWISSEANRRGLPPGKVRTLDRYLQQDKTIISSGGHVVRERVAAIPYSGFVGSEPFPGAVIPGDTEGVVAIYFNGGALINMGMEIDRAIGWFVYRRVWVTDNPFSKEFRAIYGCTCDAPFLVGYGAPGYLTGEVQYVAAKYEYSGMISGQRAVVMDYLFSRDNWKFFNPGWVRLGSTAVNTPGYFVLSSGYYLATRFDLGTACKFPRTASFTGFEV